MAQQKLQRYLERHKIGVLFEDMMSKVVRDMPDDPILYLVKVLQKKSKPAIESPLRSTLPAKKSGGGVAGARSIPADVSKSMSALPAGTASMWAASSSEAVSPTKDKGYEKPWKSNSKRIRPKKSTEIAAEDTDHHRPTVMDEKPDWNSDKKVSADDFDELWDITKGVKAAQISDDQAKRKKPASYGDVDELTFSSHGYTGPYRLVQGGDDDLEKELQLGKNNVREAMETLEPETGITNSFKRKGHKVDTKKHKKELEKFINDQKVRETDSGFHDDAEDEYDAAISVLENADDLKNEGVINVQCSGKKLSKTFHQQVTPAVHVSICARCASVMSGTKPSPRDIEYDTGSDYMPAPGVHFASEPSDLDDEDDDFESVSQVSGPRHPVWQADDSDVETRTPRRAGHMFAAQGTPSKGRPMYGQSPTNLQVRPDTAQSGTSTLVGGSVVGDQLSGPTSAETSTRNLAQTWSPRDADSRTTPGGIQTRSHDQGLTARSMTEGDDPLKQRGRSWQLADDSDVGSSVDWTKQQDKSKPARTKVVHRQKVY